MAAKFVLKKGSSGKFRFNLMSTNGKVIATSEAYETKRAAMGGINSVMKNAPEAEIDDQTASRRSSSNGSTSTSTRTRTPKRSATDSSNKKATAQQPAKSKQTPAAESSTDADRSGTTTTTEMEINLGPCHFCGAEDGKEATTMASREDGTGWIAICDEHTDDAQKSGFAVRDSG